MAMKQTSKDVLNYLKEHHGEDLTAADVADALSLPKRSVDGIFTSAIQRKNLGERVPAEVELADGTHQKIKLLVLNADGLAYNPDVEEEA